MTPEHEKIVKSFQRAQEQYGLLTRKRYAFFWTIHNLYLPIKELKYPEKYYRAPRRIRSPIPGKIL